MQIPRKTCYNIHITILNMKKWAKSIIYEMHFRYDIMLRTLQIMDLLHLFCRASSYTYIYIESINDNVCILIE